MKFKIRYADQIVGFLAILAIVILVVVIFLLGSKQRWFAKDYKYNSSFESATGLIVGMELKYKGFTIGKIKTISLDDENLVEVTFTVFDTYYNRVKEGSVIELIINPIGLGNSLLFHPGNGTALIPDDSFIPRADSKEGLALIESGQVTIPKRDDTITNVIAQVNPLLTNINETLSQLNGAIKGTGKGPLADTMKDLSSTMSNVSGITTTVNDKLLGEIEDEIASVQAITKNFEELSEKIKDPNGLVPKLIDPDGTMFRSIEASLKSVEGTLNNVEDSSSILKGQVPQIARLIEDLQVALVKGQDVLEALRNNPILKNGVQDKVKDDSSGTNSRNIEF
jgi:phospholipid/cholesterol/gamma-HCH transport system substrate-binding protein